jgi:phosphodiesterase/alkaline phosphatase D-like protein
MKFNTPILFRRALNLLLAVIIAAGGYFVKPPEPAQAELWWASSGGYQTFPNTSTVTFYCHVTNTGSTGHTIWDSVVYMGTDPNPVDNHSYDSGNIGSARGGLAPGNTMNASPTSTSISAGQTYYWAYRYRETLGGVWGDSGVHSFSTIAPGVTSNNATGVGTTTATVNGHLDGSGSNDANLYFVTSWAGTMAGSPASASAATNFSADISGLSPGTAYSYHAQASNVWGTTNGAEKYFTTLAPPSVTTNVASDITFQAATLNGSLTSLGTASTATLSFQYGLNTSYGSTIAGVPSSASSVPTGFTATLSSLTQGTLYHYRARAVTSDGTDYGNDRTFTTYTKPSVSASAATDVTYNSATLNGNVTSLGSAPSASVSFDYGTSSGSYTLHTTPVSQGGTGAFSAPISSLSPTTTYYWRAVAANEPTYGTSYSTPEQTFLTKTPPSMATDIASGISGGNVTLNGSLTSLGTATNVNVQFGYGTDHAYASKTGWLARTSLGAYNQALTGLSNGTYYFRAEADGGIHGPANGVEKSFTIGGGSVSPSAVTEPATAIGGSSATLNGNITNMGSAGSINWSFQYGTVSGYYPNETVSTAKNTAGPVSFPLAGLAGGTTYYYRAKINAGSAGGAMGAEKSFTTGLTCPTANTDTATSITADGAMLNGNLLGFGTATPPVSVSFQYGTASGVYPNDTAEQAKGALGTFSAPLAGLTAATTYYYRARVDGGTSGGVLGAEKSFRTGSSCPSATTETVTNITSAAGTLQGNLTSLGSASSVNVSFQWGTSPGVYVNETSGAAKTSAVPFSATINGLGLGTTYYYRSKADGGLHGSIFGSEKSFTTGSVPPSVITDTPTSISSSGATVNGVLTSLGSAPGAEVSFQWGTASGSYPNQTPESSKDSPGTFNRPLSGLSNVTTYYYRAKVDRDPHGGAFGDEWAFLTGSTCPTGTTQTATGIIADGATLNGNLLTLGSASSVNGCFQWGITSGVYDHQTDLHMMSSPAPFTFSLTGLAGGATCYYRAKIDGGIYGSVFGAERSFTAGSTCPTIFTDTPTTITASSAQLNGILTTTGNAAFPVNVSFQWGTAAGVYPNETTMQPVTATGTFNANISGLSSGTLYYYRAKVDDGTSGGAFGEEHSFRAGSTCPTATTQTATAISTTGTTLNGNLITLGSASSVNVMFQWGISPTVYVNVTSPTAMTSGAPFAADVTGLNDGTTYYYRSKVDGGVDGSVFGIEKSFTTGRTNPTVITDGASTIAPTGATLNGILISLGTASDVNVSFQWGTVSGVYPNETFSGNKSSIGTFQATLSSLTPGTLYYYRAKVDDGTSGGVFGLERSFRAGATCPNATTQTATDITTTTAILQGNLLSKGSATVVDVCFQWGIAPGAYTNWTPFQAMGSPAPFITTLAGLTNGVTYYYRARADGGSNGTVYGDEKSFTAGSTNPGIITDVPTLITASRATLNGVLADMGTATSVNLSFQWGDTSGVYPNETAPQATSSVMTFSDNITGLTGGTTYFYRAKVDDGTSGGAFGIERAFRTGTNSPNVTTEPATSVSNVAATLNANLISLRDAPSCNITFQWGIIPGACIYETAAIARTSPGIVSCNVTGLTPGATYYFRGKADSGLYGGTLGIEKMFITSARQPVVATETAFVAIDSAQLNGNLASLGDAPSCNLTFKWGTTSGIYAYETSPQYVDRATSFSGNVGNLVADTTYYYRAKADTVRYGGFFGTEKSFTTSGKNSSTPSSTNKGTVSFSSDAGNLVDLTALKPGDSGCRFDANQFRYGLFSFKIINLKPGAVSTVTLNLPDNMPGNTKYYKCIDMKQVDCTSLLGHNNGDKTLTLRLTDGGLGDADGRANGTIVDPGGPVSIDSMIGTGARSSAQLPSMAPAVINKDPVALSNIRVQAASISLSDAAMGESVEVTAQVSNNGNADGAKLVNIYLNGDHVSSQLVSLEKGQSKPVTFTVNVPSPGIYTVHVDNVDAGSFNVSLFKLKDGLWVLGLSCILISLLGLLVIVWRRRQSYY